MLLATAAATAGLPLLLPAAVAVDLVRLRWRMPTVRVYLFLLQYLVNDSIEIIAAPVFWAIAGFGIRLDSDSSIARHERLQWWSLRLLRKRADRLLGLRVEIDDDGLAAMAPGPVIVISRHVSLFDASLPSVVFQSEDFRVRGVIMAEMLADPGFDLIYARLGSVFVPRDQGEQGVAAIAAMAASATENTALVIFPEGRLFREAVRDRLLSRLGDSDPERAERLAGIRNLLPPRPGGLQAMLAALPDADVVLLRHRGFERLGSLADLVSKVPIEATVRVELQRFPRHEIPDDRIGQARWLDDLWLGLDSELQAVSNRPASGR